MQNIKLTEQELITKYIEVNNQILKCKRSECEDLIKKQRQQDRKEFVVVVLVGFLMAVSGMASFLWLIH